MFAHTLSEVEYQFDAESFSNKQLIAEYEAVEEQVAKDPNDMAATVKLAAYATVLRFRNKRYFDRY